MASILGRHPISGRSARGEPRRRCSQPWKFPRAIDVGRTKGIPMTSLIAICAAALAAAGSEAGTITVTTASAEARTAYLEAFDQVFAGHADLARAAARRARALDPNLLLAQ